MTIREQIEANERLILSPKATLSSETKGRVHPEEECELRSAFMKDRDRILHSEAFRRLKYKTQVFLAASNDLYRTRLTHTLEVAGIARTIAKALRLNEDLTEAITYGHDLGHPPFGHMGESVLNRLYPGGFKHNVQSLRIVDRLEGGKGLNLTFEVRDGILKHSKGMNSMAPESHKDKAVTLEGQIVRYADRISYLNHDIDDAIRSGLLSLSHIPESILQTLGYRHSTRIHTMVSDVISTSGEGNDIRMSPEILKETEYLKSFLYEKVYNHPVIQKGTEEAKRILIELYEFFLDHSDIVYEKTDSNIHDHSLERKVLDYIASMTDRFAVKSHKKYLLKEKQKSNDLDIVNHDSYKF